MRSILASALVLVSGACATRAEPPSGAPSLAIAAGQPAPAQARFYGACIAQAQANQSYDRVENTLRYRCTGAEAQAFFEALAAYSVARGSQYAEGARTWRFTQALERDTSGVDYCWREGDRHECIIVLNVGEFLAD